MTSTASWLPTNHNSGACRSSATGFEELGYHDGAGIQNQTVFGYRPVNVVCGSTTSSCYPASTTYQRQRFVTAAATLCLLMPIGPPDPNGEFEPNDDTSRMQPLRFGQTRTGLTRGQGRLATTIAFTLGTGIGFD